ncbi:uncharacterized protein [Venturia canescens]|uniref:uncharacterized protein n=1 Tax=Venturia canescens TaxID=32260 RepID=UPI001C9CD1D3|nr:uncharacterized protein LOC122411875 [Venturia canescens]
MTQRTPLKKSLETNVIESDIGAGSDNEENSNKKEIEQTGNTPDKASESFGAANLPSSSASNLLNYFDNDQNPLDDEQNLLDALKIARSTIRSFEERVEQLNLQLRQAIQDLNSNMANIPVSIKYALEAVPIFDGHNIPLAHFIEGCEEAQQMITEDARPNLARVLRNKLRGEARRAVHGVELDTMAKFTTFLKTLYAPAKTVNQLLGELGRIFQNENETALSYANRTKELGNKIHEAYKTKLGLELNAEMIANLNEDLTECFIRGLKSELETRIKKGQNFENTMKEAVELERQLQAKDALRNFRMTRSSNYSKPQYQSRERIHHIQSNIPICQLCSQKGHVANQCAVFKNREQSNFTNDYQKRFSSQNRNFNNDQSRNPYQRNFMQPNTNYKSNDKPPDNSKIEPINPLRTFDNKQINNSGYSPSIFCRYCKTPGHLIEQCRKREYVNAHKNQTPFLQNTNERSFYPTQNAQKPNLRSENEPLRTSFVRSIKHVETSEDPA